MGKVGLAEGLAAWETENKRANTLAEALDYWSCTWFLDGKEYSFQHGLRGHVGTTVWVDGGTWNGGQDFEGGAEMDECLAKLFTCGFLVVRRLEKWPGDPYYVNNKHYLLMPFRDIEAAKAKMQPKDGLLESDGTALAIVEPVQSVEDDFEVPVIAVQVGTGDEKAFASMHEAAASYSIGIDDVCAICEGLRGKLYGYTFRYANKEE